MSATQIELFDIPKDDKKQIGFKQLKYPVWTELKARLIQKYLYYFVLITKHGTYIDGFAGPQNEKEPHLWAAKLALECEPKRLRNFFLFDKKRKQYECLIRLKKSQPECSGREIEVRCGDFNSLIQKFLKENPIKEKEATFCLLDQRTFECHWSTVETLATHKKQGYKIELFYFLPIGWLDRAFSGIRKKKKLKAWWGRDDWKKILDAKAYDRAILFCKRFENEFHYNYVHPWPIYEKRGGGRIMYFMIHATDHPAAPNLMWRAYTEIVKNLSTEQQAFFDFEGKNSIPPKLPKGLQLPQI